MSEKSLAIQNKEQSLQSGSEQLLHLENATRPDVDIYHTPEAFIFLMNLPGVKQEGVKLELTEKNTLILRAHNDFKMDIEPLFQQAQFGNYYRAFELGETVDREQIQAKLEDGLLEVRIAKIEAARPRRVEIQVD